MLSISWFSICTYLPYVLVSIFAGVLVGRWKKKTTMLACDTIAAICSLCTLILFAVGALELWHLYVINKDTINIAGDDYPARLVKDKMMKISSSHIEYVFDCLDKKPTYVRNIKRYLL